MAAIYYAKIELKTGYGYPGTVLDSGEAGYDLSTNKLWIGNGLGNDPTGITMDPSFMALYNQVQSISSSTGNYATYPYVDGSLIARDSSITDLYNSKANNASLGIYATNASIGLADFAKNPSFNLYYTKSQVDSSFALITTTNAFATNASVGLALNPYATNASIGLAGFIKTIDLSSFATNASVGLALGPYATNASVGIAIQNFATNSSVNIAVAKYIPNASLGTDFYWQSGLLEVSVGSILTPGRNLTYDASGNIALSNSINLSGDVSIQGNLFADQRIRLKDFTLVNSSTGDFWWQSPRLFFRDGSADRDILQGSLKGRVYPTSPSEGDIFYRTDNGLQFVYDGSRGKYLSTSRQTFNGGRTTAVAGSTVYLRVGDATQSSTAGFKMFRNGTITGFSVDNNNTLTSARTMQVRVNDSVVFSSNIGVGAKSTYSNQVNVDFNEGNVIQVSALAGAVGSALNNWIAIVEVAWRS